MMPAVVFLLVVLAGAAAIGFTQLRAFDAARSAAREIARGEPPAAVISEAKKHAGAASEVVIHREGGYSTVRVSIRLPSVIVFMDEVDAAAVARTEGRRTAGTAP